MTLWTLAQGDPGRGRGDVAAEVGVQGVSTRGHAHVAVPEADLAVTQDMQGTVAGVNGGGAQQRKISLPHSYANTWLQLKLNCNIFI